MSEDELEQVAGGTFKECVGDLSFLKFMGTDVQPYFDNLEELTNRTQLAWGQFGIDCVAFPNFNENHYYLGNAKQGHRISRQEAFEHVAKLKGLDLDNMPIAIDWNTNW